MGQKNFDEVLIIDDDQVVCKLHSFLVKKTLLREARVFFNGKDALDYLDKNVKGTEKILILLDLNMPVMDGFEFLNRCQSRSFSSALEVNIITSSTLKKDCELQKEISMIKGCYSKPLKAQELEKMRR